MLHICLAIVSLIGLIMNGYILVVVLLTKQVSANNILLIHLALVDVLLCFFFFAFALPTIARGTDNWLENGRWEWACTMEGVLLMLLHPMALWTTCGLNCDRFYAIASPLHYSAIVNPSRVSIGLGIGWLVVILLSIPPLVTRIAPYVFVSELAACFPEFSNLNSIYYTGLYTIVTFIVPASIILGCNFKVLQIAKRHRHRIASAIYEVTLSAQVTITHQRNPFFVPTFTAPSAGGPRFRSRSPVSSTTHLVGSFLVLYLPFYITILLQSTGVFFERSAALDKCGKYLLMISSGLLVSAPSVNGLLYGLKSKVLRKSFQNYWRKQMSKNEINHEIQARTPSTCGSRRPSLTPFGLLGRPCLQRQMSELFFDPENHHFTTRDGSMKRTSSELAWPTNSRLDNGTGPCEGSSLPHTASCSTLVVPKGDNELASTTEQELYLTIKNSFRHSPNPRNFTLNISSHNSSQGNGSNGHKYKYTNLLMNTNRSFNGGSGGGGGSRFLNKVLRFDNHHSAKLKVPGAGERRESIQPQILITSACSVDQLSVDDEDEGRMERGEQEQEMQQQQQVEISSERTELCSFSTRSTETEESTVNELNSERMTHLETYLDIVARSSSANECHLPQDTSEGNATTITTIAQSISRPNLAQKRVQSLDDAYRDGTPSMSENEEQLLLLSWPIMRRKVQVTKGSQGKAVSRVRHGVATVDDEEIELRFQRELKAMRKTNRSRRQRALSKDLYSSSSSESIPSSTPSSVSLFSDRIEGPEIII